jgi:hypothetical protein
LIALLLFLGAASVGLWAAPPAGERQSLDTQISILRRQRFDLARATFDSLVKDFLALRGVPGSYDRLCDAADRLVEAELALSDEPAHQVAVWEKQLGRLTMLKLRERTAFDEGRLSISDEPLTFNALITNAELRVLEARQRLVPR